MFFAVFCGRHSLIVRKKAGKGQHIGKSHRRAHLGDRQRGITKKPLGHLQSATADVALDRDPAPRPEDLVQIGLCYSRSAANIMHRNGQVKILTNVLDCTAVIKIRS